MGDRLLQVQKLREYILGASSDALAPRVICERGEGIYLFDHAGKKYIDFSGGPHVVSIGHGNKQVREAIIKQMERVSFFYRGFWFNEPLLRLAERILQITPPNIGYVRFCNSGSEANETAIKIAHQYYIALGRPTKHMIVSRWQSYHGMTLGALSVSGHVARRNKFGLLLHDWPKIPAPLCYRCAYDLTYPACGVKCAKALDELIIQVGAQYIAGFICESIGGASTACMVPVPEYYPMIREICDKHDILLIDDEVICGFGRTGKWFGLEHWGVQADMMTVAKSMTGGYTPLAAILVSKKVGREFSEASNSFAHGFTMEGNPVSAAAALAVIDIMQSERLVDRCSQLGDYFFKIGRERLSKRRSVGDIRGKGLLMGVELVKDKKTKEPFDPSLQVGIRFQQIAMEKGCMVYPTSGVDKGTRGDHYLVSPPYIITEEQIEEAFAILDDAQADFEKEFF